MRLSHVRGAALTDPSLTAANAIAHERIEAVLDRLLMAVTGLAWDEAVPQARQVRQLLERHMDCEERELIPRLDDEQLCRHLLADHKILLRRLRRLEEALERLVAAEADRLTMVRNLDPFLKFRATLEHHDRREQDLAWPLLDRSLRADLRARLAEELAGPPKDLS